MKTKKEAAALLGVSEKAIERYTNAGKLTKSVEPKEGGGFVTYYDEKQLAKLKKEMDSPVSKQPAPRSPTTALVPRSNVLTLLAEAITQQQGNHPAVELKDKALLSIREAAAITGLSISHVKWAVVEGKLKAHTIPHVRGRKIKQSELEGYIKRL